MRNGAYPRGPVPGRIVRHSAVLQHAQLELSNLLPRECDVGGTYLRSLYITPLSQSMELAQLLTTHRVSLSNQAPNDHTLTKLLTISCTLALTSSTDPTFTSLQHLDSEIKTAESIKF